MKGGRVAWGSRLGEVEGGKCSFFITFAMLQLKCVIYNKLSLPFIGSNLTLVHPFTQGEYLFP